MDTLLPDYHVVNERTTTMINLPGHLILDDSMVAGASDAHK